MRTIANALDNIDESVVERLSRQSAQAIPADGTDSSRLYNLCVELVGTPEKLPNTNPDVRQLATAMAGLILGYAIAQHEIGEELLGDGKESERHAD